MNPSPEQNRNLVIGGVAVGVLGLLGLLLLAPADSYQPNQVEQIARHYVDHLQAGDTASATKLQAAAFTAPSAAEVETLKATKFEGRTESIVDGAGARACVVHTTGKGVMSDKVRVYLVHEQSAWKVHTLQVYSLNGRAATPPWPETWVTWRSYPSDVMPMCHEGY